MYTNPLYTKCTGDEQLLNASKQRAGGEIAVRPFNAAVWFRNQLPRRFYPATLYRPAILAVQNKQT